MNEIKYTIIIPHHDIPGYLERALKSITMEKDIQTIVIDDTSTPENVSRVRELESRFPSVTFLYTQEGKGAGHARNLGLKEAKGKWLIFVDADDFLLPDAFKVFSRHYDSTHDIIYFGITSADCETLAKASRHDAYMKHIIKAKRPGYADSFRYKFGEPWAKMVRRDLIDRHDITFQETLVSNDFMFSVRATYNARSYDFDTTPVYCVTVREGSICYDNFDSEAKIISRISVYDDVQRYFDSHHIKGHDNPFFNFIYHLHKLRLLNHPAYRKAIQATGRPKMSILAGIVRSKISVVWERLTGTY